MSYSHWNLQNRSKKTGEESRMISFPNCDDDVIKVHKMAEDFLQRNKYKIGAKAIITLEERNEYGIITIIPMKNPSIYKKEA